MVGMKVSVKVSKNHFLQFLKQNKKKIKNLLFPNWIVQLSEIEIQKKKKKSADHNPLNYKFVYLITFYKKIMNYHQAPAQLKIYHF